MERCENCQNILPRTVDRCPVCGTFCGPNAQPATPEPETIAWGEEPPPVDQPVQYAQPTAVDPSSTEHFGDNAGTASDMTPSQMRAHTEASAPTTDAPRVAVSKQTEARKVLAASSRIEANVQVGPTEKHRLIGIGAIVASVLALVVGATLGFPQKEVIAVESNLPTPSTLPLTDSNAYVIDATGVAASAENALVQITVSGCGTRVKTTGFISETGMIVTTRSGVLSDPTPIITLSNGTQLTGKVIGWSVESDIAIVEPSEELSNGLRWGSSRRLVIDSEIAAVQSAGSEVIGTNHTVEDFATRNGVIQRFLVDGLEIRSGSPALNEIAAVVAVADGTGRLVPGEDVRALIGRYRVDPTNVESDC